METIWQELSFGIGDSRQLVIVIFRLAAATLFGAAIGYEREKAGKAAGLRTHMLVTAGTAVFVLAGAGFGMTSDGLSRVIQGIVTGIGFIGAGSIIKRSEESDVEGLTTSAGIWMAAAIGVAVGLGEVGIAGLATILSLIILTLTLRLEKKIDVEPKKNDK